MIKGEIRFIDLGLKSGIKWSDWYITRAYHVSFCDRLPKELLDYYFKSLPLLQDFLELKDSCNIKTFSKGIYNFYMITGPNGNKIRIPRGVSATSDVYTFYTERDFAYWTRDWLYSRLFEKSKSPGAIYLDDIFLRDRRSFDEIFSIFFGNLLFVER